MASVGFRDVTKVFDDGVVALDHLELDIGDGEMFGIVGASGCGKSTALRVIAGLDDPTEGSLLFDGVDVTHVPTSSRGVGIVTQRDTLLGHRTGRRNVRLPLELGRRRRGGDPDEIVAVQARELGIEALLDRRPSELSRGERRAVQLARAVVARPAVLLLDEPLAYMDQSLRRRLRDDIVGVRARHGVTCVLVTADQADAVSLCDRIAMLVDGQVHQVASPAELLERPATTEAAAFFGEPAMNLVPAAVRVVGGERRVRVFGREIRAWSPLLDLYDGATVTVGVRAADLRVTDTRHETVPATVDAVAPFGHRTDLRVTTAQGESVVVSTDGPGHPIGAEIRLAIRPDRFHWFDPGTGMAVLHPAAR